MSETRPTIEEATERLLSPGTPFELCEEEVLGEKMLVYKNRARSLRDLLQASAAHGDKEYFVFDNGRRITFTQHLREVASVAKALRDQHGIEPGDRVAILAANCPDWILTYWACVSMGVTLVAMNGWWAADEIRYGVDLAEPKLLIADERRLARLEGADLGVPTLVIERDFEALRTYDQDAALSNVEIPEDTPASLLFTSGTTGRPKGALISHRTIIAFITSSFFIGARRAMCEPSSKRTPGAILAVFPLFHLSGMWGSTSVALAAGSKTVWPTGRFDAGNVIELSKQEGITTWGGASTHVFRLLDHPDLAGFDTESLMGVGIGGSATTPEIIRRTEERLPHLKGTFGSGYGSTETGGLVSYADNKMVTETPGCVGPPLPSVQIKIVDDDGNELPDGVDGRVCARSPMIMLGYWRNDKANEETILPGRWLDTGDVGQMRDGRLILASRKRDMIIRGGENIYPIEIENRIEAHPGVAEVAVYGVDHVELGQEVKAVVVPREGHELDPEEVKRFAGEQLAYFKVPEYVEIRREALPRNATGKVMKHVLSGEGENTFVEE